METLGIWVSGIIVVVVIIKALIYLFSDHGSMPGPKTTRYTINDEDNNDILTNPIYSHLPYNIWYDNSSSFDDD